MMVSVETCLRQGHRQLRRLLRDPRFRSWAGLGLAGAGGFALSAASLRGTAQPLAMGLILGLARWQSAAAALGSCLGYLIFWGKAGIQGIAWSLLALAMALVPGKDRDGDRRRALDCALAAFLVSAAGLVFQLLLADDTPFPAYLLRIALAAAGCALFPAALRRQDAILNWVAGGVGVLALANVTPLPFWNLGCCAAACLAVSGAFPAAALAGLGLDIAGITAVPMGAVLCAAYFARLSPIRSKWIRYGAPGAAGLLVMALCGVWDLSLLPGLVAGGALGMLLPAKPDLQHRRGETGLAQVRLEVTAGILAQTQQLLLEAPDRPIDEEALLAKAMDHACAACSARSACLDRQRLSVTMLHDPSLFQCRRTGRIRAELSRSREQLKALKADRQRQDQYRWAVIQQYQFLSDYLRSLADRLPRRGERIAARFRIEVSARSASREEANGDCCAAFSGTGCRYFVLLCDGMGTGLGAAEAGNSAAALLKKMLLAGLTGEQAFRSVNSLLALRGQAGAVTLDLAEIRLDTGRVYLYKWGAAPSYILSKKGMEKAGTATPPPGISVTEGRESVRKLSLRRGESLILLSDGVELGEVLRRERVAPEVPPGELAERILELGAASGEDDATAVVIRLRPNGLRL